MLNQATYLPGFYPKSQRYVSTLTIPVLALSNGKALLGADHQVLYRIDESALSLEPIAQLPGPPMLLARDSTGSLYVAGQTKTGESCLASGIAPSLRPGDVYVTKLQLGHFEVACTARMAGSCNTWPTSLAVDASGEATFAVSGNGFPMHNPLLINNSTFSVARLNANGSALVFSTEVPSKVRAPVAAVSPQDDSIFASSSSTGFALLKVPVNRSPVVVSRLVNALSWTRDQVHGGMLATIAGENLSAVEIDLGLNAAFPTHAWRCSSAVQRRACRPHATGMESIPITVGREDDGRWWADVEAMPGVMAYGVTRDEAIAAVRALALRVAADCIDHGEEVPEVLARAFSVV